MFFWTYTYKDPVPDLPGYMYVYLIFLSVSQSVSQSVIHNQCYLSPNPILGMTRKKKIIMVDIKKSVCIYELSLELLGVTVLI